MLVHGHSCVHTGGQAGTWSIGGGKADVAPSAVTSLGFQWNLCKINFLSVLPRLSPATDYRGHKYGGF
jgi:hypothetical protein